MPRTGRFGRLPRQAPNLSSIIVQMAKEIQALEDQNILKAWEEGGLYKGKPVTDKMLIDHFTARRDAVPKTDPLWDKWNNQVTNFTFAIEESKMSLKYDQGKVNESQMASFYTKWAKKLPTDSEAYRELMRAAARFMDAAKSRGGGGGGGGGGNASASTAFMTAHERYERPFQSSQEILLEAAVRHGILQITETEDPDDLMDLRSGNEMDHLQFMGLFDQIRTAQPGDEFHDLRLRWEEAGLGEVSYDNFVGFMNDSVTGLRQMADIANSAGDSDTYDDMLEAAGERVIYAAIGGDTDEYAAWQDSYSILQQKIDSGNYNQFEVSAMIEAHFALGNSLRSTASPQTQGFLYQELQMLANPTGPKGPTPLTGTAESTEGAAGANEPAALLGDLWQGAREDMALVQSGQAVLFNNPGQPWTTMPIDSPALGNPQVGSVLLTHVTGVGSLPVFVQHIPIYAQGAALPDPVTGRPTLEVPTSNPDALIGYQMTYKGTTLWGIYHPEIAGPNKVIWHSSNPFAPGIVVPPPGENGEIRITVPLDIEGGDVLEDGEGNLSFDAFSRSIDSRALNTRLVYTGRLLHDTEDDVPMTPLMAMAAANPAFARTELVNATPEQVWQNLMLSNKGDVAAANREWDQIAAFRDPIANSLNRETAGSIEYRRLGMVDGYVPPDRFLVWGQTSPQERAENETMHQYQRVAEIARYVDPEVEKERRNASLGRMYLDDPGGAMAEWGLMRDGQPKVSGSATGGFALNMPALPDLPPELQPYVNRAERERRLANQAASRRRNEDYGDIFPWQQRERAATREAEAERLRLAESSNRERQNYWRGKLSGPPTSPAERELATPKPPSVRETSRRTSDVRMPDLDIGPNARRRRTGPGAGVRVE